MRLDRAKREQKARQPALRYQPRAESIRTCTPALPLLVRLCYGLTTTGEMSKQQLCFL